MALNYLLSSWLNHVTIVVVLPVYNTKKILARKPYVGVAKIVPSFINNIWT